VSGADGREGLVPGDATGPVMGERARGCRFQGVRSVCEAERVWALADAVMDTFLEHRATGPETLSTLASLLVEAVVLDGELHEAPRGCRCSMEEALKLASVFVALAAAPAHARRALAESLSAEVVTH